MALRIEDYACSLLIPLVGFSRCSDPARSSTIDAVRRELMWDGLVLRYRSEEHVDGLPASEGAFNLAKNHASPMELRHARR